MAATQTYELAETVGLQSSFGRVLVGVDGSPEAREAARQAAVLAEGPVTLLAVYDVASAVAGGTGPFIPAYYDDEYQREAAEKALAGVSEQLEAIVPTTRKLVRGCAWDSLIREIEREQDTLVAVGSHGAGRARGFFVGSTATELVHQSPCSVLVARKAFACDADHQDVPALPARPSALTGRAACHFETVSKASGLVPTRIVVGVDGSPESAAAYMTARDLAERFHADLRLVVAHGGKAVDKRTVEMIVDDRHEDSPDEPVDALVAAAVEADLLVVGSRGLRGLKSVGSVSERVAHQAGCSVLVVREPPWLRVQRALAR